MSAYINFYGEGSLGPQELNQNMQLIQNSGFNSVTFGLFHIGRHMTDSNGNVTQHLGDIVFNDTGNTVVSGGNLSLEYGKPWMAQIEQLRSTGQISKVYFSFGGGYPVIDFTTLKNEIMVNGEIPEDSSFYKNFMILGAVFAGAVDGIDIDNEDMIETDVIAAFGKLALAAGFREVTFCPPFSGSETIWLDAAVILDQVQAGAVTLINAQSYGSSDPQDWPGVIASYNFSIPPRITGGVSAENSSPSDICTTFSTWQSLNLNGFIGGFVWSMEIMGANNLPPYASAIQNGMDNNCG